MLYSFPPFIAGALRCITQPSYTVALYRLAFLAIANHRYSMPLRCLASHFIADATLINQCRCISLCSISSPSLDCSLQYFAIAMLYSSMPLQTVLCQSCAFPCCALPKLCVPLLTMPLLCPANRCTARANHNTPAPCQSKTVPVLATPERGTAFLATPVRGSCPRSRFRRHPIHPTRIYPCRNFATDQIPSACHSSRRL